MGKNIHIKPGSEKVICTAYFKLGWLSEYLYSADQQYGRHLYEEDPSIWHGYVSWAHPVADFISANGPINVAARYSLWPFVKAWALEMAHRTEPDEFPRNQLGAAICAVGLPVCRLIGIRAIASHARRYPMPGITDGAERHLRTKAL